MTIESKTISSISELKVGEKSKKTYFIVDFTDSTKAVCFVPALHNELEVGKTYPLDITPPQKEGYSPSLVKIITAEGLPPETSGQERGLWWKELGEMLRCGDIKEGTIRQALRTIFYAKMFSVLEINLQELKDEAKTTPPSKPATTKTQSGVEP